MGSTLRNVCLALAAVGLLFGRAVPSRAQDDNPFGGGKPSQKAPTVADLVTFEFSVKPEEVKRGEAFTLTITGKLKSSYHTYPITQRSDDKDKEGIEAQPDTQLSKLIYGDPNSFTPLWPVTESEPKWVTEKDVGSLLEYEGQFTWTQEILVLPGAATGRRVLPLTIALQVCDAKLCRTDKLKYDVPVQVSTAEAVPLSPELTARRDAKPPAIILRSKASPPPPPGKGPKVEPPDVPGRSETPAPARTVVDTPRAKEGSLWGLLLASIGAAIAMLFTPCVFPMIPITVSFFLKQSEKEHHKPFLTAGVYSLTIIVVLALAVLVLGKFIIDLANSAWLNLGLGAVLIFFSLSLFGMYEIELPNFLARFTSTREGRGGYAGAFFMALTFTITSFTCTGPFLGPLLVTAKEMRLSFDRLLMASFAYSATFAAPFFVMALFPSLLKKLPRSGGWLNSVKVVMGFLELAAALKFLGNMDAALNPGNPRIFTFETVLCAWVALSAACGLYLFGLFRLPHDSPVESIGVPRMVLATIFIGLALYMVPALFRKVPQGLVGEGLYAFLPLDTSEEAGGGGTATAEGRLDWHRDYQEAWAQAVKEGKPIFIDFTGVTCTNCRANENRVFPRKEIRDELAKFVRVQLYTDTVPERRFSASEAKAQADRNSVLQSNTFNNAVTPLYVVFVPDKTEPFSGDKLNGSEVARWGEGYIENPADFAEFLKDAQTKRLARVSR